MQLHTLNIEEYKSLLQKLEIDLLKANTFGLEDYFPLKNKLAVDKLYHDYKNREGFLEDFLKNRISIKKPSNIIWCESGRINNNQYIYKKENGEFKYENEKSNYFENVFESKPFCACIVIDFFGLFGLNHSNDSRNFLNKNIKKQEEIYNAYLDIYLKSILNLIKLCENSFKNLNHTIAAPAETSKSILKYLRFQLKIRSDIKIYKLNSKGLVSNEYSIDIWKQTSP
jgi:hypothetical protein